MSTARIVCGWCGEATPAAPPCLVCGRDPSIPYEQRGQAPIPVRVDAAGRPTLDEREIRKRLAVAQRAIEESGRPATVSALAEQLEVDESTVRRWRRRIAG